MVFSASTAADIADTAADMAAYSRLAADLTEIADDSNLRSEASIRLRAAFETFTGDCENSEAARALAVVLRPSVLELVKVSFGNLSDAVGSARADVPPAAATPAKPARKPSAKKAAKKPAKS